MSLRSTRKRIRIREHDYRLPGPYFITIALAVREPRFGNVSSDGRMELNDAGQLVTYVWLETPRYFPALTLQAFVLMPDHMHAILTIGDGSALSSMPTLGNVVQRFKSLTTVLYGKGVRLGIYPPYEKRLWQFRYHDHIIRDAADLAIHRGYILTNPRRWAERVATGEMPSNPEVWIAPGM